MASHCWLPQCNHRDIRERCSMFRFPKEPLLLQSWLHAMGTDRIPTKYARLCSCHFPEGKKENGPQLINTHEHEAGESSVDPRTARTSERDLIRTPTKEQRHTEENADKTVQSPAVMGSSPKAFKWETTKHPTCPSRGQEYVDNEGGSTRERSSCVLPSGLITPTKAAKQVAGTSPKRIQAHCTRKLFVEEKEQSRYTSRDLYLHPKPGTSKAVDSDFEEVSRTSKSISDCVSATTSQSQKVSDVTVQHDKTLAADKQVSVNSHAILMAENYFLKQKLEKYEKNVERWTFARIAKKDQLVTVYTGLPNARVFEALFSLVKDIGINYYYRGNVHIISKKDQLFLCLMKLRQNFPHDDLAERFKISQALVSNIIVTWIHVLHEILFKQLMSTIPSRRKNQSCLPTCFSTFTNCRIILDCTEMATTVPRESMLFQKMTYSAYKHRNTCKALIGVAPNGVVTYASELYPGATSDRKIVLHSQVLTKMEPGDLILADKGFLLRDILPPGVNLNIPPFLATPQFTPYQVQQTETIARARVHVERAIRRMKVYRILSFVPRSLLQHASAVFQVIASLTNLQYPLIKEVEGAYSDRSELSSDLSE